VTPLPLAPLLVEKYAMFTLPDALDAIFESLTHLLTEAFREGRETKEYFVIL
jgi:hypothetical protein